MKDEPCTFRFKSKAIVPGADHWSNWMHSPRTVMKKFLDTLQHVNDDSGCKLSPREEDRRVIDAIEVIDYKQYGTWRWLPQVGWKFISGEDGTPRGKGKRPQRKQQTAEEAFGIFG